MTDQNLPEHSHEDLDAPLDPSSENAAFDGSEDAAVVAEARSGQGLPLRGIAMVLIAVAIGLIAWGLVSFFSDSGDDSGDGGVHAEQEADKDLSPAEQARLAKEKEAADREAAKEAAAKDAEAKKKEAEAKKAEAEKKAAAEREAAGEVKREDTHVTVLNNSPIEGLAGRTAGELRDAKWDAASVGNLPDTAYVFRESVVLYPAGDAQAKAAAEQIGEEFKIPTRERNKEIDDSLGEATMLEGPKTGALVVVTVNDLPH